MAHCIVRTWCKAATEKDLLVFVIIETGRMALIESTVHGYLRVHYIVLTLCLHLQLLLQALSFRFLCFFLKRCLHFYFGACGSRVVICALTPANGFLGCRGELDPVAYIA